ncbi:MAG: hypothetical protein HY318_08210, partial [Armatimonadetes bacterium]|nr:hypothetical protein [Armatimonadota bacterium]
VWAYRFERPQGPVWVVWNEDGSLHLPGRPATKVWVRLPWQAAGAQITDTPTLPGQSLPERISQSTREHTLSVALGATPVFIEEAGAK